MNNDYNNNDWNSNQNNQFGSGNQFDNVGQFDNQFDNSNQFENGSQFGGNSYHASSNLNTAIENPNYDVNSAMGMNLNNAGMDSSYYSGDGDSDTNQSQFIPNNMAYYNGDYSNQNDSSYYEPVMEKNNDGDSKIKLSSSREFQITLFIVFILLIFILLMPYIYDFFKDMQLVITS